MRGFPAIGRALRGLIVLAACLLWSFSALAAGGNPLSFGKPDFDLTGRVYDDETKEPIEGAYVVAIYYERLESLAVLTHRCRRTRGMYTGKDGTFRFPIEKLDNLSPGEVMAIKPGYFSRPGFTPTPAVQRKQGKEAYTGRDLPLKKQDPANPSWQLGHPDVFFNSARSPNDVEAAIEFLSISLNEEKRLKFTTQRIESTTSMIEILQAIKAKGPTP